MQTSKPRPRRRTLLVTTLFPLAACGGSTAPPSNAPPERPAAPTRPAAPRDPGPAWANGWARGEVFYEIFVRSFQDSDGDGKGDLKGLLSRLDTLNDGNPTRGDDLGVDGLWLMPVFTSPSYHGYDVTDYRALNPDYGTLDDFKALLAAAHQRGIKVIVDFVINHTSAQHPWFEASASSPASPKRDWYVWRKDDPGWTQPWGGGPTWHKSGDAYYYGLFWGGMPDLNLQNPTVRAEIESIAKYWFDVGVDGFRLDAARHIVECGPDQGQADCPQTHRYWQGFSRFVRGVKPDALLVGENWTSTDKIAPYYGAVDRLPGGDELPASFDFPLAGACVAALESGDATAIVSVLDDLRREYPAGVLDATFLTNHDMPRLATQLGGDAARLRQAPAVLLTLPGTPFLYYGEEIGLPQGRGGGDEAKRTPLAWDSSPNGGFTTGTPWYPLADGWQTRNVALQQADAQSVWRRYQRWIAARHASAALREGTLEVLQSRSRAAALLAFVRKSSTETALVFHNLGDQPLEIELAPLTGKPEPLAVDDGLTLTPAAEAWRGHLPAHASGAWTLR